MRRENICNVSILNKGSSSPPFALAIVLFLCTVLAFSFFPEKSSCSQTQPKNSASKVKIESEINSYRIKIRRLQQGINKQKLQVSENLEEEKEVLMELESIESRIRDQQTKVTDIENKAAVQQALITIQEEEIGKIQAEKQKVLGYLKKRISAYYTMGKIGILNVTFSTRSLPELLKFHDAFDSLIEYDQQVIEKYRVKIDELSRARDTFALEKEVLNDFLLAIKEEEKQLDLLRLDKEQLLTRIRTQKLLHDQAIEEMEQAADSLSESLVSLKSKEQVFERTFAMNKGSLPPPVSGSVVALYNQNKTNKLGVERKYTGIAISAPDGTQVKAISPGTVIFSGYLRGYGNTVIIHHGFQYYSITSRFEKLQAAKGNKVNAGDVIGSMSETATLIDEGLYFEIRHRKQSQDPLDWLNTSKLKLPSRTKG